MRETADERALRLELENEERLLACEEAIYLRDGQSGATSTGEGRAWQAKSWAVMLDEMPPAQIVSCAVAAMKAKPNSYKISARDVLAQFRGEEWHTDENGKTERVTCANGGAYESWEEIKARDARLRTHALAEPLPPLEISPDELKRRLRGGLVEQKPHAPVPDPVKVTGASKPARRESCEETLHRLQVMLDDAHDKRILIWFSAWHRKWHESHPGQQMEIEAIETEFEAFVAEKKRAKTSVVSVPSG